jgi:hypothetical protein
MTLSPKWRFSSFRMIWLCAFLIATPAARSEAPQAVPTMPGTAKALQPDPASSDPSLLLDLPDADNAPKPVPKKVIPVPKVVPKPQPQPVFHPPTPGPNQNRIIQFDRPVDPTLTLPLNTEVSIILSNNKFFPSKFRLREGLPTKLFFTTVNKRPGALIIERLKVQRWIAKEKPPGDSEADRARWESSHEINSNKITEVVIEPKAGTYNFHDALSGATGEITVE